MSHRHFIKPLSLKKNNYKIGKVIQFSELYLLVWCYETIKYDIGRENSEVEAMKGFFFFFKSLNTV